MIVTASGRSALIAAAGLFVLCAGPVRAETGTEASAAASTSDSASAAVTVHKYARHGWHHRKGYARHRSHAVAAKADPDKSDKQAATASLAANDGKVLADIPPSVANANAQLLLAGVQLSAAAAIPTGSDVQPAASDNPPAAKADDGTFVVAADQLNDVDRSLREGGPPAAAVANPPPAQAATMTPENSVWDHTSLIGKIFIGFGALLTMASAARMFIA